MKKALTLILLIYFSVAYAQTYRYFYECSIKKNGNYREYQLVLDINDEEVKFYDYKFLETDSLNLKNKHNNQKFRVNSLTEQVLKRKRNSHENSTFFTNSQGDYFMVVYKDPISWKLLPEHKKVEGHTLQKATTQFGGRQWEAWFSPNIPFHEGPYKFSGLPGLIFEIKDDKEDFIYKLVKSTHIPTTYDTHDFIETYYGQNPITITHKQKIKVKLDDFGDPVRNLVKIFKDGGKININGQEITAIEQLEQRKKTMQEDIIKSYVPIELDKAIPYSLKK
ncbi:GLPGLI family protein [Bergeyella zoohelcum]|uniref:GLPGLI family protein n=1 Tax=Bergeyella zoohelcum ATCC 43767 TaxID=883096 RepID=K1MVH3_9FLAO|nr:GLPGLI family protein [Bergeyella zoohelcum]EKB60069.1 hypothetical protein HMPREF9699_00057 [Bergeyella zoohelcum ATCC 43767]SUV49763.1 GLPGLI family protein [Bergeyella zoohelcum]